MSKSVEYRVRPVTRYVITRFESEQLATGAGCCGSEGLGEFDNERNAYRVGYALCKAEHEQLGYPPGDPRIKYPDPIPQREIDSSPIASGGLSAV